MNDKNLDRILGTEDQIVPSSGFLSSVMERVREEAAAPKPMPFPWRRAVPGMVLAAGVLGWCGVELVRRGIPTLRGIAMAPAHLPVVAGGPLEQAGWVALALGISLASWLFSRRMAGQSGLL